MAPSVQGGSTASSSPGKRKRQTQSCIECRRRKKTCEGEVPGCVACVRRGTVAECRYGDDRDRDRAEVHGDEQQQQQHVMTHRTTTPQSSELSMPLPLPPPPPLSFDGDDGDDGSTQWPTPLQSLPQRAEHTEDMNGRGRSSIGAQGGSRQTEASQERGGRAGAGDFSNTRQSPSGVPSWRTGMSSHLDQLPQRWQADRLIQLHRLYLAFGGALLLPDADLTREAYAASDSSTDARPDVGNADGSVLALLLVVCASALNLLPSSMTFPVIVNDNASSDEKDELADVWTHLAVQYFEQADLYGTPRLETVAGLVVYELNLVASGSRANMIHRMDAAIRISRILGLDCLGSADDDQRRWDAIDANLSSSIMGPLTPSRGEDPVRQSRSSNPSDLLARVPLSSVAAGRWAATTYAQRDHVLRESGRSLWYILLTRDWNAGPQSGGTFSIYPGTFTTQRPKVLLEHTWTHAAHGCEHSSTISRSVGSSDSHESTTEQVDVWFFMVEAAACFRKYHQMYTDAASRNEEVCYEDVIALDAEIVKLLQARPTWIRPESGTNRWRVGFTASLSENECVDHVRLVVPYVPHVKSTLELCCAAMNIISGTMWHKFIVIHRPFLAPSLSQPRIYGLSQRRTLYGAFMLIEMCDHHQDVNNSTVALFRLQHAAVALVTMLLLQGALYPKAQLRKQHRGGASHDSTSFRPLAIGTSDMMRLHRALSFVIQLFKEREGRFMPRKHKTQSCNAFAGIAIALERLLTAATRMNLTPLASDGPSTTTSITGTTTTMPQPRSVDMSSATHNSAASQNHVQPNETSAPTTTNTPSLAGWSSSSGVSPSEHGHMPSETFAQLDNDLLRLMRGLPMDNTRTETMAMATAVPVWDATAQHEASGIPQRAPWVANDVWKSIFDSLKDWNIHPGGDTS